MSLLRGGLHTMQAITFRCTSCEKVLKVAGDKAGRKAKCTCGAVLTIPNGSAAEPTPPPPPPKPKNDEDEAYGLKQEAATVPDAPSAILMSEAAMSNVSTSRRPPPSGRLG